MLNERISIEVEMENKTSKIIDLYDAVIHSLEESFCTESALVWYVLECADMVDEINDAVSIEAESVVYNGSKEIKRITATVR